MLTAQFIQYDSKRNLIFNIAQVIYLQRCTDTIKAEAHRATYDDWSSLRCSCGLMTAGFAARPVPLKRQLAASNWLVPLEGHALPRVAKKRGVNRQLVIRRKSVWLKGIINLHIVAPEVAGMPIIAVKLEEPIIPIIHHIIVWVCQR